MKYGNHAFELANKDQPKESTKKIEPVAEIAKERSTHKLEPPVEQLPLNADKSVKKLEQAIKEDIHAEIPKEKSVKKVEAAVV